MDFLAQINRGSVAARWPPLEALAPNTTPKLNMNGNRAPTDRCNIAGARRRIM